MKFLKALMRNWWGCYAFGIPFLIGVIINTKNMLYEAGTFWVIFCYLIVLWVTVAPIVSTWLDKKRGIW